MQPGAIRVTVNQPLEQGAPPSYPIMEQQEAAVTRREWTEMAKESYEDDGFVITAFLTRRIATLEMRKQLWP